MIQTEALNILKTGANVFLTGEPGSGKTYVSEQYIKYLRQAGVKPAVTASTGIAATHLGGQTIHAWSGIGVRDSLDGYALDRLAGYEFLVRRLRKTQVLIIDEISMLSAGTLDMVETVCRTLKRIEQPFGGLQVVLVGDLFQLPPITSGSSEEFVYQSAAWQKLEPVVCYLDEQYRHQDRELLTVLSGLRRRQFGAREIGPLKARQFSLDQVPAEAPKLFTHNVDVDRVNNERLAELPGESRQFSARTQGPAKLVETLKRGCLSPEILALKPGAVVMFTKNDFSAGFVNGTLGRVEKFSPDGTRPVVRLQSGRTLKVESADWVMEENGRVKARFSQVPLRLAWAITVHKSQGMSLDQAVVDLSRVFAYGQGYVALSRVRSLSGLYLLGLNQLAVEVHPTIRAADAGWRDLSRQVGKWLAGLTDSELGRTQKKFLITCGGRPGAETTAESGKPKPNKADTLEETLSLWQSGCDLNQIAVKRQLKPDTVLNHLEQLVDQQKLDRPQLRRLLEPELVEKLSLVRSTFKQLETDKLSPVYYKLGGRFTYRQLRMVRLVAGDNED